MNSFQSTPHSAAGQSKPRRQKKNTCCLLPADGQPGIRLLGAKQPTMVNIGCEAAERYLSEGEHALPEFWAHLRRMTPVQHLGDVEAGFMGRIEQRMRSLSAASQSREPEAEPEMPLIVAVKGGGRAPMAVGGAAVAALLKQLEQLASMAAAGAIQATSSEGAQQLRCVQELLSSTTLIGAGGRTHG